MKRRWFEFGVVVVAVWATVATSRPRWHLEAELPKAPVRAPAVLVIEASREPFLVLEGPKGAGPTPQGRSIDKNARWPGKASFLVPEGYKLVDVTMPGDRCRGGLCSSDCTIPEGEYVRIVKVTRVATWKLEVVGEARTDTLDPRLVNYHTIDAITSEPTQRLTIDSTLRPKEITTMPFQVFWPDVDRETTITWQPHIIIEGACPDENPCEPPPTAKIEIRNIHKEGWERSPRVDR
jgi:hypothetical protein